MKKKVYEEGKDFNSLQELLKIPCKDFYLRGYFGEEYFKDIKKFLIKKVKLKKSIDII